MRDTEAGGFMLKNPPKALMRALRLSAVVLGIGLVMAAGAARAQEDDEEDSRTFERKIMDNIMSGIGGTSMNNKGIDYRERSPLVVPPKIDLPPPESPSKTAKQANWPKDPDIARRKAYIEAQKKDLNDFSEGGAGHQLLMPDQLNAVRKPAGTRTASDPGAPGSNASESDAARARLLSPSELGFSGKFGDLFGSKSETAPFKGEPTRETLTQPPVGYQTPSPNYAYGAGPQESLTKDEVAPQNMKH